MAVLVIEDDDDLRAIMAEILVEHGHRVTAVANLDDARKYLAAFTPSLIVLDGRLEGKSARTLLLELQLRDVRIADKPPVLLVSGSWGSSELADEFAVPFLAKPFEYQRFVDEVHLLAARAGSGEHSIGPLDDRTRSGRRLAVAPLSTLARASSTRKR